MKIKIHKENENGYVVYRKVGSKWRFWLPEEQVDCRGDRYYDYYKTAKAAEKAARKEKQFLEENDRILDI